MKKIQLKFQKEVISILSGNELSKIWGGRKKMYSIDACETKEECNSVVHCDSLQESCQGKCLSDGLGGGDNPVIGVDPNQTSPQYCQLAYKFLCPETTFCQNSDCCVSEAI